MSADGNAAVTRAAITREQWHEVYTSAAFTALRRRRGRIGWSLTAVTMVLYVGFFIVVALAPGALGDRIPVFGSVGILLVVVLFFIAFAMVWGYLSYSSRHLASAQKELVAGFTAQRKAPAAGSQR
jgi:uncharacterized membrane protein (DUF485 family)